LDEQVATSRVAVLAYTEKLNKVI